MNLFNKVLMFTVTILFSTSAKSQERRKDTARCILLMCDTLDRSSSPYEVAWKRGYSIRELHNNTEGLVDPYSQSGFKYTEYWVHVYYITEQKKPIPTSWIVWQSVLVK